MLYVISINSNGTFTPKARRAQDVMELTAFIKLFTSNFWSLKYLFIFSGTSQQHATVCFGFPLASVDTQLCATTSYLIKNRTKVDIAWRRLS